MLNHYLAHFEAGCPSVTDKYVSALVALINDKKDEAGSGATEVRPTPSSYNAYQCVSLGGSPIYTV